MCDMDAFTVHYLVTNFIREYSSSNLVYFEESFILYSCEKFTKRNFDLNVELYIKYILAFMKNNVIRDRYNDLLKMDLKILRDLKYYLIERVDRERAIMFYNYEMLYIWYGIYGKI